MRWSLLLLAACKFQNRIQGDAAVDDGGVDTEKMIDAAPADMFDPLCFGAGTFGFCLTAEPSGAKTFNSDFTTTNCTTLGGARRMLNGVPVCMVEADTITNSANVDIGGDVPLVLVAKTRITIGGHLDASSLINIGKGPGANPASCKTVGIDGTYGLTAGSGGAGGAFGTAGGAGGAGAEGVPGSTGNIVAAPVETLRGGCLGGDGQDATVAAGGDGGGAIYLVTHGTIDITGIVNTSGAGGGGGAINKSGGGGGGSGGMIVLHAGAVMLGANARLVANGGGGGAGGGQVELGADGADANEANPTMPAPGGSNGGMGGTSDGGNGATRGTSAQGGQSTSTSGGGGGGGLGVIRILAGHPNPGSIAPANASPTPTN